MGLRAKLNLIVGSLFAIAIAASTWLYFYILEQHAEQDIALTARLMAKSAHAARDYTVEEIEPLLKSQQKAKEFKKPAVSFYAAKTIFDKLQAWPELHAYEYMLPTINPTKAVDRPLPYELEVIRYFIAHPEKSEYSNVYDSPDGPVLRFFEPIKVDHEGCLDCHSEPKRAPASMLAEYQLTGANANNGFGWKMGQIVGAQEVSVPMASPLERARSTYIYFIVLLVGIFIALFGLLNILLHFLIIKPVSEMSRIADAVSLGKLGLPEYVVKGSDEIASLSASFNRMRRSLEEALKE